MSLLRILAPLGTAPLRCEWALIGDGAPRAGEGPLTDLPRGADRVQLLIPAAQVLITRAKLPQGARRRAASVLAFAVEEASAAEPEANHVSWLGTGGDIDLLAVVDRQGLQRWREALEAVGLRVHEVHSELLLLPRAGSEWSLAWDGAEGFVRTGEFEGGATDGGDAATPPLALRMLLDEAERPSALAIYGVAPDVVAWQRELGIPVRAAGAWDWRAAAQEAGVSLAQERRAWRIAPGTLASLRPAAWIAGAALAIHGVALVADWMRLGAEQRAVRAQMEARFRRAFPEAVAVADPALQMRRQLAAQRHRAGLADGGDFAPMIERVAAALKELPAGTLRTLSYESGRISLELAATEPAALARIAAGFSRTGLSVETNGKLVIAASAALLAIAGYLLVLHSAERARGQLRPAVAALRTQAALLEQQAAEYERLRAAPAIPVSATPLRALVQARLDAARLSGTVTRMDALDADHLSITFGAVPFAQWLAFAGALQAQQVRLESARIEALAAAGLVSVNASFARARAQ